MTFAEKLKSICKQAGLVEINCNLDNENIRRLRIHE
jgi:hypothetical protein